MSQPERPVGYLGLSGGVSGGVSTVQVPAVDVPRKSHWVNLKAKKHRVRNGEWAEKP